MGSQKAVPCKLGGKGFSHWPSNSGDSENIPNYVGVLDIGWSYILSLRLWETIGNNAMIKYTSSMATVYLKHNEDFPNICVDIGEVTEDACRRWAAILAPSEGWKATVIFQDQEYLAPRSISVNSSPSLCIGQQ